MSLTLSVSCSCSWELWEYMIYHIRGTNWVSATELFLIFLFKSKLPFSWWLMHIDLSLFIREWRGDWKEDGFLVDFLLEPASLLPFTCLHYFV